MRVHCCDVLLLYPLINGVICMYTHVMLLCLLTNGVICMYTHNTHKQVNLAMGCLSVWSWSLRPRTLSLWAPIRQVPRG